MTRILKTAWALALALLACVADAAPQAKLALLQANVADAPVYEVLDKAGIQQPEKAQTAATWKLARGGPIATQKQPAERLIELYTGTPSSPVLLARVLLRYYRSGTDWAAHFQLIEEPALVKANGRWQPLQLAAGMPALLVQHGGTLPNAEGFFPRLEFGLTTGPLALIAWQVR